MKIFQSLAQTSLETKKYQEINHLGSFDFPVKSLENNNFLEGWIIVNLSTSKLYSSEITSRMVR